MSKLLLEMGPTEMEGTYRAEPPQMLHCNSVGLAGYLSFKVQAFKNKDCIVPLGICLGNLKPRQGRVKWGSPAMGTAGCVRWDDLRVWQPAACRGGNDTMDRF